MLEEVEASELCASKSTASLWCSAPLQTPLEGVARDAKAGKLTVWTAMSFGSE
jgi:hypothetical protein